MTSPQLSILIPEKDKNCFQLRQVMFSEAVYFIFITSPLDSWRRGGVVVSALDFRSGGQRFEPGLCRRVVSLEKKLYSTLSLLTQVYNE